MQTEQTEPPRLVSLAKVEAILAKHRPAHDSLDVECLSDALEFAAVEAFRPPSPRLRVREADQLRKASERVLRIGSQCGLLTLRDRRALERIRHQAGITLIHHPLPGDQSKRDWVWGCCLYFLRAYADHPEELPIWRWGDKSSPAMKYLVECCQLIDCEIDADAIMAAFNAPKDSLGDDEDARAEAYENWGRELERKLSEYDLRRRER